MIDATSEKGDENHDTFPQNGDDVSGSVCRRLSQVDRTFFISVAEMQSGNETLNVLLSERPEFGVLGHSQILQDHMFNFIPDLKREKNETQYSIVQYKEQTWFALSTILTIQFQ